MSSPNPRNLPASVQQRLINLARAQRKDANLIMTRFALERYLYRLSRSPYADAFVLKGAALFVVWAGSDARPTRDVDLLARVEADLATVRRTVAAICRTEVEPDGLNFQPEAMQVEAIQALRQFGGFRVIVPVLLGRTRLQVQIDLGFGDAVTPAPQHLTYPTLLDFPAPQLVAYHMETVIAEKLEAMIKLGTLNTRTKDYYDLLILSRAFPFNGQELTSSILVTFSTRETAIPPGVPEGLSEAFANDAGARSRWGAFLRRNDLPADHDWPEVVRALRDFLLPPFRTIGGEFQRTWPAGGPWQD